MSTYTQNIHLPHPPSTGTTVSYASNYIAPIPTFNSSNHKPILTIPNGEEKVVLEKDATLQVNGSVVINGINLEERLSTIEKVLQIPQRDVIMESKYPKLAELYRQYMHELEKLKTWEALKESK